MLFYFHQGVRHIIGILKIYLGNPSGAEPLCPAKQQGLDHSEVTALTVFGDNGFGLNFAFALQKRQQLDQVGLQLPRIVSGIYCL